MRKIGLIVKEASENRIRNSLKENSTLFVIKYSGLSSPDLTALRHFLKDAKANLFVAKNSVARRALKNSGLEEAVKYIEGPCGLVFVKEEPIEASKALYNFAKEHEHLKLEGGYFDNKILQKNDIETMAKLPAKEVLRAQVVMALNSPISALVITLNQVLAKFVYCLDQIRQKKQS